ncbi:MAG: acyl-CoA dehydrogenase [Betaproteobacteria bacterium]|nr:acyl-CoA dehydrogenase [Betaproteobacteria bacterium]
MNLDPLHTDDQRMIADSAKRFAERHGGPARLRTIRNAREGYDTDALGAAADAGWIALLAPEAAGGTNLGPGSLCLIAEALGNQLCVLPLAPAAAAALALAQSRSAEHTEVLRALISGDQLVLPALRIGNAKLEAKQDSTGAWTVSGRCDGIPATSAAGFIVEASGKAGHIVFYMANKTRGLKLKAARAVDGTALSCLNIRNLAVPKEAIIAGGDAARALAAKMNEVVQLSLAAEMLGLMDGASRIVLEYLGTRVQFGQPIGKFQALRHQSVDNYAQKETVRALVFEAARSGDMNGAESGQLAIAARVLAGEASLAIAKSAIQLHGAIGFTDEHNIGLFLKRAMAQSAQYGPTGALRRQYRESLKRHADGHWPGLPRVGTESTDDARFRADTRQWLEANLPAHYRNVATRLSYTDTMAWHRKLVEGGLIAPGWPREYGGMGASLSRQVILADELARVGAPEISGQAINHIGPILQRFGTPAQKAQHLGPMLRGECVWCQGYSEPNAGSDLASLRTKAAVMGDHLIVNGQKIWTTWAHNADWIFALVRTNPDAPRKQEGISFILIDMKTPGITRRPIHTIAGDDELATVFFDDVKVPIENVVGEINSGWKIANALLVNERLGSAGTQRNIVTLHHIWRLAAASGLVKDEAFLDRLAGAEIELTAIASAYAQAVAMLDRGQVGAESSFIKIAGTALLHRLSDMLFEAASALGGGQGAVKLDDLTISPAISFLQNRRATIYGGTQEIQKDIVAKRVLNLP